MENYTVNEEVYLRFQVENLQDKDFDIEKAWFKVTLNGKPAKNSVSDRTETDPEKIGIGDCDILENHVLGLWFCPQAPGTHMLDIWYEIPIGGLKYPDGTVEVSDKAERRTVRIVLVVVQ